MDKATQTEFVRTFLIEGLPEPLTRADQHIQIFDNYIANTRMRIRTIRYPETKSWEWILQQRITDNAAGVVSFSEIHLNEAEHNQFELFEGTEVRKNRYYSEFEGTQYEFDVYLGKLWGLNIARVLFTDTAELKAFSPLAFAVMEITDKPFFAGENIVEKIFSDVQAEVAKLSS